MNKFNTLLRLELKANSMLAYIRGALKGGDKAARRMLWAYLACRALLCPLYLWYTA